jgi:hypothetical protein
LLIADLLRIVPLVDNQSISNQSAISNCREGPHCGRGGGAGRDAARAGRAESASMIPAPKDPAPWKTVWLDHSNHISRGISPWDTGKVNGELERRGLNPRPDMVGQNFKSFPYVDFETCSKNQELRIKNSSRPSIGRDRRAFFCA